MSTRETNVSQTAFLRLDLDYFPKNCGDFGEEWGERFHQDIHFMNAIEAGRM